MPDLFLFSHKALQCPTSFPPLFPPSLDPFKRRSIIYFPFHFHPTSLLLKNKRREKYSNECPQNDEFGSLQTEVFTRNTLRNLPQLCSQSIHEFSSQIDGRINGGKQGVSSVREDVMYYISNLTKKYLHHEVST